MDFNFAVNLPKWNVSNGKNGLYSLWDYFGFPVGVTPAGKSAPCDFPKRGYNLIWNEYFRDENLQQELDITSNEDVLFSNVSKDYFTSAFTERQRGPITGLPVNTHFTNDYLPFKFSSNGKSIYSNSMEFFDSNGSYAWKDSDDNIVGISTRSSVSRVLGGSTGVGTSQNLTGSTVVELNKSNNALLSTAFDITDLRLATQVQKWQERSLRGGVRYTEFLHSFFGVNPRDDRLQRPEYIGGIRNPVIIQDVLQTSQTTETSAQATESGHMISADGNYIGKYRALEYGWIFGILRIMPKIKYTNGINRQFLRNTPFDYYFPTFANLSEQGIYNEEVFATNSENDNLTIWGFQGIYNEMRYKPNRVVAGLRDSNNFLFWTMARKFTSLPNLNEQFISTKYMQNDFMRVFQITDANLTRPCIVHVWNGIEAYRPMPYIPIPA